MSEGLNRVMLIGNLGQDPDLRYTQAGTAVLNVRMATTESFADSKTGERKDRVEWHTVIVWGRRAEALAKLLSKGARIGVEGRLQTRQWEDAAGSKRYSTEVQAMNVLLLGGRPRNDGAAPAGTEESRARSQGEADPARGPGDDDIPF